MAFPYHNPGSDEATSPFLAGLSEAVRKLSDTLEMNATAETNIPLTETYINEENRFRIFECAGTKKGWLSSPAVVIKKNGTVINPSTSNFEINYLGGSIEFTAMGAAAITESDVFTADVSYVNTYSQVLLNFSNSITQIDGKVSSYKGFYNTLVDLVNAVGSPVNGDYALILGSVNMFYIYNGELGQWLPSSSNIDLSDYYTKSEIDIELDEKEPNIDKRGDTLTDEEYYYSGRKTWVNVSKALNSALGILTLSNTAIANTDDTKTAFGKTQGQINALNDNKVEKETGKTLTTNDLTNTLLEKFNNYETEKVSTTDIRLTNARPASDVYAWAKQPEKPTYTADDVGALPDTTSLFSGNYNDLSNKPTIPSEYTLPTASSTVKGGVKIGNGLVMNGEELEVDNSQGGSNATSIQGTPVSETAPLEDQVLAFTGTEIEFVGLSTVLQNAVAVGQTTITTTNGAKNFVQTVGTMYSGRKFIAMAMWQSYSSIVNPFAASLLGAGTVTAQGKITLTNLYGVTPGTFNLVYAIF